MAADLSTEPRVPASDRYDFERLEVAIEQLLEEHDRFKAERKELMAELADREHRVSTLESQLDAERAQRKRAVESVDGVIARMEALQASVAESDRADGE